MCKLSIIIPAYNVKYYIKECIESVLSQTCTNFEIILIDDGSNDGTDKICELYPKKDSRIKFIKQTNKGLSNSRNFGLDISSGEYILFLDGDDYISNNTVLNNLKTIFIETNCDIIYASYTSFVDNNFIEYKSKIVPKIINLNNNDILGLNTEEILKILFEKNSYYCAAQSKIYKRDFIEKNNLRFIPNIYHEDEDWTPRVLLNSKNIYIYNEDFYMRRYRENSIMTTKDDNIVLLRIKDMLIIANNMINYVNENCNDKSLIRYFEKYFGEFIIGSLKLCSEITDNNIKKNAKYIINKSINLIDYI